MPGFVNVWTLSLVSAGVWRTMSLFFIFLCMKKFFAFSLLLLLGAGCRQATVPSTTAENTNTVIDIFDVEVTGEGASELEVTPLSEMPDVITGGDSAENSESTATEEIAVPSVREFTIHASNFTFSVPTMSVKSGDTVRLTFVNDEGFHDFRIDEFGVATKQIGAGAAETVEFVANQSGNFEYYCSVGSHRALGMKGTLTVE